MALSFKLGLLFIASSLFVQATLGELLCEDLPNNVCAFAIASSGKRCVLENSVDKEGKTEYQCKTSEEVVERMSAYIETDGCVKACGVNRDMVGISSDGLLDSRFIAKLCSPSCSQNCPNIIDLYFNLAAGEGVFLPDLCEKHRRSPRRAMVEFLSSGAAPAPVFGQSLSAHEPAAAPASI
ncbi:hypothetical protein Nepgr_031885 [Nepenthes gracilis]|uniref:PAR1 protein n=1 Tax=Nepenthes gracilis TaxID=150966 RepID=A0AAD3Y572_NEPGR|nr:hypothetical protein Nepgr_031885 [Nepenthes gracilis]